MEKHDGKLVESMMEDIGRRSLPPYMKRMLKGEMRGFPFVAKIGSAEELEKIKQEIPEVELNRLTNILADYEEMDALWKGYEGASYDSEELSLLLWNSVSDVKGDCPLCRIPKEDKVTKNVVELFKITKSSSGAFDHWYQLYAKERPDYARGWMGMHDNHKKSHVRTTELKEIEQFIIETMKDALKQPGMISLSRNSIHSLVFERYEIDKDGVDCCIGRLLDDAVLYTVESDDHFNVCA